MEKIVCVLYVDPIDGYPKSYRGNLLKIDIYPGGQNVEPSGSETAEEEQSIFSPHLETEVP